MKSAERFGSKLISRKNWRIFFLAFLGSFFFLDEDDGNGLQNVTEL